MFANVFLLKNLNNLLPNFKFIFKYLGYETVESGILELYYNNV
jgi:hypothetical protein